MPQARPLIGVPSSTAIEPWYSSSYTLPASYLQAIEAAGAVPLLIQPSTDPGVLDALYTHCDGLLLAGGEDIHPEFYHAAPHPRLELTNTLRDATELTLARRAVADHKPILGICRGLQLLNVALGGTLYQHLPDEFPSSIDHAENDQRRDFRALTHAIELDANSWLAETLATHALNVNSLHHQGIRDLAPALQATGYAPDGLIEVVEMQGQFAVAVQSHPELLWADVDTRWQRMFSAFVDRCRE